MLKSTTALLFRDRCFIMQFTLYGATHYQRILPKYVNVTEFSTRFTRYIYQRGSFHCFFAGRDDSFVRLHSNLLMLSTIKNR